ncbi:MAG: hypothetical protein ACXAB7_24270, partial [Candidatus Kariarchaeaceae archaeon]
MTIIFSIITYTGIWRQEFVQTIRGLYLKSKYILIMPSIWLLRVDSPSQNPRPIWLLLIFHSLRCKGNDE